MTELRYYPFGAARYNAGNQVTTYRFTGQRWDSGTALYFYQSRWYDPLIGRFLAADTIVPQPQDPQNLNRYTYALNNALKYTDPSGHCALVDDDSGGLCVRHAKNGTLRIVRGGYTFANRVEKAIANAIFSGDSVHLNAIPTDTNPFFLQQSVNRVAVEFGDNNTGDGIGQMMLDPMLIAGVGMMIGKETENTVGTFGTARSVTPLLPDALAGGKTDTHVYLGYRNGKPVYDGITNDLQRRQAQHGDRFIIRPITTYPVTRGQARAIEQALIVQNPQFENINNSISPRHSWYQDAVNWGNWWLRQRGY